MLIFSQRLKDLRNKYGRTQSEIASALDMTTQNYSAYEKGREPPYDVLVKISRYFNVTTDYLLGLSDYDSYEVQISEKNIVINIEPYKKDIDVLKLLPNIMKLPSFLDFFKSIYIYVASPDSRFKPYGQKFTVSEDFGIMADFRIVDRVREAVLVPFIIDLLNDMQYEYDRKKQISEDGE